VRSVQMALATGDGTCRRTQRAVDVDDARCYLRRSSLKQCQQWDLRSGDLPALLFLDETTTQQPFFRQTSSGCEVVWAYAEIRALRGSKETESSSGNGRGDWE
jgi:hypothetical protein